MGSALKLVHTTPHPTPPTTPPDNVVGAEEAAQREVFDAWVELHRHAAAVRPRWTPERQRCIATALGWGFGVGELVWVCVGGLVNPFCQGDNRAKRKFDDLLWLLATPERVERLANEGAEAERAAARRAEAQQRAQPVDPGGRQRAQARLAALRDELAARQRGRG